MPPDDHVKTSFIAPWGTFSYKVIPLVQRTQGHISEAMIELLHDMIHKEMEVYMDDMIAKYMTKEYDLVDLKKISERLRDLISKLIPTNMCLA